MSPFAIALYALLLLQPLLLKNGLALEVNEEEDAGEGPVTLLRCCRNNQELGKLNGKEDVSCFNSTETFAPIVYSPSAGGAINIPASWTILENARPTCPASRPLLFVSTSKYNPFAIISNGDVFFTDSNTNVKAGEYCVGIKTLLICTPSKNESEQAAATMRPKLRMCCGSKAVYVKNACVESEEEEDQSLLLGSNNSNLTANMDIVSGFPGCPHGDNFTIISDVRDAELQTDASILINNQRIPADEFCIERIKDSETQHLSAKVFACLEHAAKGNGVAKQDIRFTLYPIGFIISAIFLAATLAAGWLLPASHHVLHWRCQTHHVACLMLGDITMAAIQLAGNSLQGEYCRSLAILAHFFFLATFFWLNTMCFNIWWTFRDLRPASLEKGQELLRLRFYGAYAWGGPLIVAGLAAFLDHIPETPGQTFLRPRFGERQCWFYGDIEMLAYFYGPIGVLLAINLLFFAATARELTCGLWKGEFVKSTTERAALGKVCLKLVVVMGVPWIFEVISWMVRGPDFLWYVTDLCNAAQGVLIFIVVGCQPQVRAALKRFWSRNPRANANRQGNGLSTTSHGMPSMGDSVTQNPSTKTAPLETIC